MCKDSHGNNGNWTLALVAFIYTTWANLHKIATEKVLIYPNRNSILQSDDQMDLLRDLLCVCFMEDH